MGIVHRSTGGLTPASPDLRSEPWIVSQLAYATVGDEHLDWRGLAENMTRSATSWNGRYSVLMSTMSAFVKLRFCTTESSEGQSNFFNALRKGPIYDAPPSRRQRRKGSVRLDGVAKSDQYNTTIYGLDDRYRGVKGNRRVLFMNADDMVERGWKSGKTSQSRVILEMNNDTQTIGYSSHMTYQEGTLAAYFRSQQPRTVALNSSDFKHAYVEMDCLHTLITSNLQRSGRGMKQRSYLSLIRENKEFRDFGLQQLFQCWDNGSTPLRCSY